jgi:hypothetical protein
MWTLDGESKRMSKTTLPNGLDALMTELSLADVMSLIERTARWVDPSTFDLLPVWYPEFARKVYFYKSNWSEPQTNTNRETRQSVHKQEGNLNANKALTYALGLRTKGREGWSCCHLWGVTTSKGHGSQQVRWENGPCRHRLAYAHQKNPSKPLSSILRIDCRSVINAYAIICHHRHVLCLSCKPMEIPACVSVQASCEDSGRPYSQTVHHDQAHYDPTATNAHQKQLMATGSILAD